MAATKAQLNRAMRKIPARSRDVVRRRSRGETLKAIGRRHGVTRERIRQIHVEAMTELRQIIGATA